VILSWLGAPPSQHRIRIWGAKKLGLRVVVGKVLLIFLSSVQYIERRFSFD
jgi:hypothetical protein